ncbi:transcription initiation Spt4 [Schizophyllum commune Tattone D]|uniref:Transcription elongation factor SPT4 n=1 Tax=Schizophyllum commune (strain H4-8 / FGSC 9210) TaxID=578458 RepID=D8QLM5_SCHCM|nr:transcription initiation Spt4 [Schizophyllum commune H4-8]KAI4521926.1 transcription initiation Spt4 [Schizophyllum commune Loenen D]KAI5828432.1 transcription initiation Spt4 [Schizophyllum commune Tattone D]KAI5884966.1 transcription initiation Spt4 [Schizophyllum commune H4-8]
MAELLSGQASIPGPKTTRHLRACMLCSLIQTSADFKRHGCPNCDEVLQLRGSLDRVQMYTTNQFEGVIAVIDPEQSWVARWQRTAKQVRGMYAVRVKGRIGQEMEETLEARGIKYRPRDGTDQD